MLGLALFITKKDSERPAEQQTQHRAGRLLR